MSNQEFTVRNYYYFQSVLNSIFSLEVQSSNGGSEQKKNVPEKRFISVNSPLIESRKSRGARILCRLAKLCCFSSQTTDDSEWIQTVGKNRQYFYCSNLLNWYKLQLKKKYRLVWYRTPEKFVWSYGQSLRLKTALKIRNFRFIVKLLKYILEKNTEFVFQTIFIHEWVLYGLREWKSSFIVLLEEIREINRRCVFRPWSCFDFPRFKY